MSGLKNWAMKILCFDSKFGFHPFPGQLRGTADPLLLFLRLGEMPGPGWLEKATKQIFREKVDLCMPAPFRAKQSGQFIFQVVVTSFLGSHTCPINYKPCALSVSNVNWTKQISESQYFWKPLLGNPGALGPPLPPALTCQRWKLMQVLLPPEPLSICHQMSRFRLDLGKQLDKQSLKYKWKVLF